MNARQIIVKEYGKSRNFMTPRVIRYGKITRNRAYELSVGEGLVHEPIWGVSVVDYDPTNDKTARITDLGHCFLSLQEAEEYIRSLKNEE